MNTLLLSPHTDDVELGCGGSVVKFMEAGDNVLWVVFSSAADSLPEDLPKDTLRGEFLAVAKSLGLNDKNYKVFNYQVRDFNNHRQEILQELARIGEEFKPDLVVGPSLNDFHQDHKVIADAMIRMYRITSSIICYELPWNHMTFDTQLFVKLEKRHIAKKSEMLMNYKSQLVQRRGYFTDEFIYGLAKVRGVQCNSEYAEAFEVIRWRL
ncbi:MAG: PIG-L family deacetylase [SAR202 cluster bacterium]|jgi:LmbE family N-acetylglucosaminyl deacetylase|nr:PIG-L family deacetylase [SAR202 cluster bacterium]